MTALKLVKTESGGPPRPLGKHGLALWRVVQAEYAVTDVGGVETLCHACQALDRAEEFAALIARDGAMLRTKTGVREHPLIKHELASRAFVVRTLQRLGLDVEALKPVGRPGVGVGVHWKELHNGN